MTTKRKQQPLASIERTCNRCDATKPLAEFFPHPMGRDGYREYCLACHRSALLDGFARKRARAQESAESAESAQESAQESDQESAQESAAENRSCQTCRVAKPASEFASRRHRGALATRCLDCRARQVYWRAARDARNRGEPPPASDAAAMRAIKRSILPVGATLAEEPERRKPSKPGKPGKLADVIAEVNSALDTLAGPDAVAAIVASLSADLARLDVARITIDLESGEYSYSTIKRGRI